VHRSMIPSELMVDMRGNLKVMNLRLSKHVGIGKTYTICGDREYLSPEQVKGTGHGLMCDCWMLGITLYELLMGCTPFPLEEMESEIQLFKAIVHFDPVCYIYI
jgi:serine/threonine protein kinase